MIEKYPGYGFFGSTTTDALFIQIDKSIKKLKIEIFDEKGEILNLKNLEIVYNRAPKKVSTRQSSYYSEKYPNSDNLLSNKSIHTAREINPYWEAFFIGTASVKYIKIYNRPDKWSLRSRNIIVTILDSDDNHHVVYKGGGLWEEYDLQRYVGNNPNLKIHYTQLVDIKKTKNRFCSLIKEDLNRSLEFYKNAIKLVDIWGYEDTLSDEDATIIAGYLIVHRRASSNARAIMPFSGKLKSREDLNVIEKKLDQLTTKQKFQSYGISKHGLQEKNILKNKKDKYLPLMTKIMSEYNNLGYDIMLAYGTLLGAAREGAFLKHDDDVDLIYHSKKRSEEGLKNEIKSIIEHFKGLGYKVNQSLSSRFNIHIRDPKTSVRLDVFPCWEQVGEGKQGTLSLHMDKMKISTIDKNIMIPPSQIDLEGHTFPAPNMVEDFLVERYGNSWKVEDPFFDFLWKLN